MTAASPESARVEETSAVVRQWLGVVPRVAIVLGSGLGSLVEDVRGARRLPYGEIPGFPLPSVAGHKGQFVAGTLGRVPVLVQDGRFHFYEGHGPDTVVLPVRVLHALGIDTLVVTNAAGGVHERLRPGTLMLIADHLNLMWRSPLAGPRRVTEERFPDLSAPYDAALRQRARDAARDRRVLLDEGVYAGLLGPSYETPAEVRMLERLGADAVGMSTVPEVIVARASGLRVLGVSMITNVAAGRGAAPVTHADVLAMGERAAGTLAGLLADVLGRPA